MPVSNRQLPRWRLREEFFRGTQDPALHRTLDHAEKAASDFCRKHAGKPKTYDGKALGETIAEFEKICEQVVLVENYTRFLKSENTRNRKKVADIGKRIKKIYGILNKFEAELIDLPDHQLWPKAAAPELARYAPWIHTLRTTAKTDRMEGHMDAYYTLLDKTRFQFHGKKLTYREVCALTGKESSSEVSEVTAQGMEAYAQVFADLLNKIMAGMQEEDEEEGFKRADEQYAAENNVTPDVLDSNFDALSDAYRLSHEFHRWYAQKLGVERMQGSDVGLERPGEIDLEILWPSAKRHILRLAQELSPEVEKHMRTAFANHWIDAQNRKTKEDEGAYCLPVIPGIHPFVFLRNFNGDFASLATLIHELFHSLSYEMAAKKQSFYLCTPPQIIDESFSLFAELLLYDDFLKREKSEDPAAYKTLLAERMSYLLNQTLASTADIDFQRRIHAEYRKTGKALSVDRINSIWLTTQRKYFGESVKLGEKEKYGWIEEENVFARPFYEYAYAFDECLAIILFDMYAKCSTQKEKNAFVSSILEEMGKGGTECFEGFATKFGLDPHGPEIWKRAVKIMHGFMSELKKETVNVSKPATAKLRAVA